MLSKEASSAIFWVFGMARPGIEPQSPWPLANTLPTRYLNFLCFINTSHKTKIKCNESKWNYNLKKRLATWTCRLSLDVWNGERNEVWLEKLGLNVNMIATSFFYLLGSGKVWIKVVSMKKDLSRVNYTIKIHSTILWKVNCKNNILSQILFWSMLSHKYPIDWL